MAAKCFICFVKYLAAINISHKPQNPKWMRAHRNLMRTFLCTLKPVNIYCKELRQKYSLENKHITEFF